MDLFSVQKYYYWVGMPKGITLIGCSEANSIHPNYDNLLCPVKLLTMELNLGPLCYEVLTTALIVCHISCSTLICLSHFPVLPQWFSPVFHYFPHLCVFKPVLTLLVVRLLVFCSDVAFLEQSSTVACTCF